jgi:hypothetical protein
MSAADHVHPKQLAMLYPAGKLADPDETYHWDEVGYRSHEHMAAAKLAESKEGSADNARWQARRGGKTLYEDIAENGVRHPVEVDWGEGTDGAGGVNLSNGHHRVFAAADIDPSMEIPVRWVD